MARGQGLASAFDKVTRLFQSRLPPLWTQENDDRQTGQHADQDGNEEAEDRARRDGGG